MPNKIINFISTIFGGIWMLIVFSEFWQNDPGYRKSLKLFQYYDLLVLLCVFGFGIVWFIKKRNKPINYVNGLSIFFVLMFLDIITITLFYGKLDGLSIQISGLFSHLSHFIGVAVKIFLVYLVTRLIGMVLTTTFPLRISNSDLPLIQVACGIATVTGLLFFLGFFGILNGFILVPICLIVLIIYWRYTIQIIKDALLTSIKIPKELNTIGVLSFLFLALFLVINYVQILRPFPIGSDSLNLYVNIPVLLNEYKGLVDGYQPYNWSLFMSIGLVVFNKIDVVLGLSFLGGILSLFTLFQLSRKWININYAALVLLLFYSTPMINFLSYMDMKVDMGLLFITLCVLLTYYNWIVPTKNKLVPPKGMGLKKAKSFFKKWIPPLLKENRLLVLIGLLAGFAFGIKLTILFFFLALHCTIWFIKGGKLTFLASFFLCLAAVFLLKLDTQPGLRQFHQFVPIIQWSLLFIGLGLCTYIFITRKEKLLKLITYSAIISTFFVLPALPWLGKNYVETGKLSVNALLNGKKRTPVFDLNNSNASNLKEEIAIPGIYQLPDNSDGNEKRRNRDLNSSISEDLHRFMGYEIMPVRYLSLPYDVFIKTNISNHFTDVGFVLLLLFPIMFLFPGRKIFEKKSIYTSLLFMTMCTFLLIISIPGAFLNNNKLSDPIDGISFLKSKESIGFLGEISDMTTVTLLKIYTPINNWLADIYTDKDPITYTTLIILFLLILSLVLFRIKRHSKTSQSMVLLLLMYFFLWWLIGAGVAWYGMLIFTISYILLFKGICFEEEKLDESNQTSRLFRMGKSTTILSVCSIWIFLAFAQRSSNYEPINKEKAKHIYYPSVLEYQTGNLSEEKLTNFHFPNLTLMADIINQDDGAYVYRIGSAISYFIQKNDSRVLSDNFMDFFEKLIRRYNTKEEIIDAFKSNGFKYIVFDLNMASYDETPDKTLTKKFYQFMNTLYQNPKVELIATDRQVRLADSNQVIYSIFQDKGTLVNQGTIALYEIK